MTGVSFRFTPLSHTAIMIHSCARKAEVFYEWNQLEEARRALRKVIHDAATYQHIDLHLWGCELLLMVELAAG